MDHINLSNGPFSKLVALVYTYLCTKSSIFVVAYYNKMFRGRILVCYSHRILVVYHSTIGENKNKRIFKIHCIVIILVLFIIPQSPKVLKS